MQKGALMPDPTKAQHQVAQKIVKSWGKTDPSVGGAIDQIAQALAKQQEREDDLRQAFYEVCQEDNIPQYEDIKREDITGDCIRHGVRQLAAMFVNEQELRRGDA